MQTSENRPYSNSGASGYPVRQETTNDDAYYGTNNYFGGQPSSELGQDYNANFPDQYPPSQSNSLFRPIANFNAGQGMINIGSPYGTIDSFAQHGTSGGRSGMQHDHLSAYTNPTYPAQPIHATASHVGEIRDETSLKKKRHALEEWFARNEPIILDLESKKDTLGISGWARLDKKKKTACEKELEWELYFGNPRKSQNQVNPAFREGARRHAFGHSPDEPGFRFMGNSLEQEEMTYHQGFYDTSGTRHSREGYPHALNQDASSGFLDTSPQPASQYYQQHTTNVDNIDFIEIDTIEGQRHRKDKSRRRLRYYEDRVESLEKILEKGGTLSPREQTTLKNMRGKRDGEKSLWGEKPKRTKNQILSSLSQKLNNRNAKIKSLEEEEEEAGTLNNGERDNLIGLRTEVSKLEIEIKRVSAPQEDEYDEGLEEQLMQRGGQRNQEGFNLNLDFSSQNMLADESSNTSYPAGQQQSYYKEEYRRRV